MKKKWMAAAFLLVPIAAACGGGGSNSLVSVDEDSVGVAFTPQQPSPGPNSTAMGPGIAHGNAVAIQVNVTDTDQVYGGAFRVDYDPTHVEYIGYSPGTLLEQSGHVPTYQVDGTSTPGQVVVGVSRTGDVPAVTATDSEPIIVLNFRVLAPGTTALDFSAEQLFDGQVPPQTLSGQQWFGGTLQAN